MFAPPRKAETARGPSPAGRTAARGASPPELVIGPASDPLEREADRVADEVMRIPEAMASAESGRERSCEPPSLPVTHTAGGRIGAAVAPDIVYEALRAPSRPLDAATRAYFEPRFGRDFSHVRVHSDTTAMQSADAIHAGAFTVGHHIVLSGASLASDRRLMSHELVHTVQQSNGSLLVSRQPAPGPAPPAPAQQNPKVTALKAELVRNFGLSAVEDSADAVWTLAELEKMKRALSRVHPTELAAIKGVRLLRVKKTTNFGSIASGLFQPEIAAATGIRNDRIEIADEAFDWDKDWDEGGASETFGGQDVQAVPSERTLGHEVGHAVEDARRRAAEARQVKAGIAETTAAGTLDTANRALTAVAGGSFQTAAPNNRREQNYTKALVAAQTAIAGITTAIDNIPGAATAGERRTGLAAVKRAVASAKRAINQRNRARRALPADSAVVMADVETEQDASLAAAGPVVTALESHGSAQDELEKSNDAAGDARISIDVPGGGPVQMSIGLAQFVALVDINRIDLKPLGNHAVSNWPQHPEEAYAEFYTYSLSAPAGLQSLAPALAKFFSSPVGAKRDQLSAVQRWINRHQAATTP